MMWAFEVGATTVEQFLCLLWGKYIFGVQKIKWKWSTVLILFSGVTIITILNTFKLYSVLTAVLSMNIMFWMIRNQYEVRIRNAVSGTIGYVVCWIVSEYFSAIVLILLDHKNLTQMLELDTKARVCGLIISKLLLLFEVLVFSKKRMHAELPEKKYWNLYCIGNIMLILICIYLWKILTALNGQRERYGVIGIFGLIAILMGIMLYQFSAITEGTQKQCELELIRQHNKYLTDLFECNEEQRKEFHKLRHDMKNYMIGIQELLKQERTQEVEAMIDSWLKEMHQTKVFIKTGNQILDSILEQKVHLAEEHGVHFKIDVDCQEELGISVMDLCALFGNALDNAIEGAMESEKKNTLVFIKKVQHYWIIKISNSCDHDIIQTDTGLATTKRNKEEHGIGFRRIQEIVDRYGGRLEWNCENGVFCLKMVFGEVKSNNIDKLGRFNDKLGMSH